MMDNARQALRLFEEPAFRQAAGLALRPGGLRVTERVLDLCRFPTGARLLDVGCGRGASLALLRSRGFQAAGLDRSPTLLAEAGERWNAAGPAAPPPLVRADGGRLPFRPGAFDGLLCECVLSLLSDRRAALREFHVVLAEGGLLALCDVCLLPEPVPPQGGPDGRAEGAAPRASCLDGAVERDRLENDLAEAGFRLLAWEDHRRLLAELAARLVFASPVSLGPASGPACGAGCARPTSSPPDAAGWGRLAGGRTRGRFGYFLAIAAKGPAERGRFHAGRGAALRDGRRA